MWEREEWIPIPTMMIKKASLEDSQNPMLRANAMV